MKRNMDVKKNVDDLLCQIMIYMNKSGISDNEFDILCIEMASTCIAASISFNPDDYYNERSKVIVEIGKKLILLSDEIIKGIDEAIENDAIKHQFEVRGK